VLIADRDGLVVPRANNLVRFTIDGPGEILAVDNGDPTAHDPFRATTCRAFNGRCLAIIRTRVGTGGEIVLEAASDGLEPAAIQIVAKKAERPLPFPTQADRPDRDSSNE